jgi:alpha-beta hydrolase superfamily lysophospholipase
MSVDLPGQGDTPFQGLYFRPDFETPMRCVLDHALSRPDVDQARLAAYGISAGGYMVPRSAAFEPRIKACIANSMIFDMYEIFLHSPIPRIKGLVRWLVNWRAPFQMRMLELIAWRWGINFKDPKDLVEKNRNVRFDPALIQCPTLILIGEGEYQNHESQRQQHAALQALPNERKQLLIAPANEGGAHHCIGENLGLMSALVFDWLDDVFK